MSWPSTLVRTKNWGTEVLIDGDLEGQFDLQIAYILAFLHGTTGHAHTGASNQGPKITLTAAAGVTGTLPLANGGTGQTSLAALGNLFYPVGSLYVNITDSTNPATLLGFGTWTAIAGRFIVGFDAGQTEFDSAGETGGEKTHTLTEAELPTTIWGNSNFVNLNGSPGASAGPVGGGGAHNNLPPYKVGYVWYRTA